MTTSCQLCNAAARRFETPRSGAYYHCSVCDFIFASRELLLPPAEERDCYEEHNNSIDNEGYVKRFERFIDAAVLPYAKQKSEALDYGCGPGPVLQLLLQRRGFAVDIFDPYFAPDIPSGKSYDLVTCTEVLEHAYEPHRMWKHLLSLLNPGGHIAIMTVFHLGCENFANWWYKNELTHVCFYSLRTFAWLCDNLPLEWVYDDGRQMITLSRKEA